jgi:hypothetical protein
MRVCLTATLMPAGRKMLAYAERIAHTSTQVRARAGPRPCAVKETPASDPYRTGRRVLSYARVWCPHMHSRVQLNGKQAARHALNLCCPRNGKRPATPDSFLLRRACVFTATVQRTGREGKAHEAASPDTGQTRRRHTSRRRPPESARDGCEGAAARRRAWAGVFPWKALQAACSSSLNP